MLLDDQDLDDLIEVSSDERGPGRLAGLIGALNWRAGMIAALALLTGGGATLASTDLGGLRSAEPVRIETDATTPAEEASTATTVAALELRQSDASLAPLAVSDDETTSTSEADGSTASTDASTTSTDSPSTDSPSTDSPTTSSAPGRAAAQATTRPSDSSNPSTRRTTTSSDRTTTSRRATSTSRDTSTTGATTSTTRATTSTTRATTTQPTTTTTQPTTTTTQPTTTTTQPTTTSTQAGNSCATGAEFELMMRDDFNGSSIGGQWLRWDNDTGNAGNGRRMASTLSTANGVLTIKAEMVNGVLHSGGMNHTVAQTYGKYRFRVRTDVDPSRAMSGVILTWPASNVHPRDGENNVYETLPHESSPTRDPFYTFIHKPYGSHSDQEYKIWRADANQWQTMTMEWTPSRITITRDGGETWTVNETGADLIPDVPHRFHIQLDATKQSISGPVTMQVDFAEVYRYCG